MKVLPLCQSVSLRTAAVIAAQSVRMERLRLCVRLVPGLSTSRGGVQELELRFELRAQSLTRPPFHPPNFSNSVISPVNRAGIRAGQVGRRDTAAWRELGDPGEAA
jgi:hypothetical protein